MGVGSHPSVERDAACSRDESRRGEKERNPGCGFLCLRAGDQPDNEAASSEGKGRARDAGSCSLAARDAGVLSTAASSALARAWSLQGGLARCSAAPAAAPARHSGSSEAAVLKA